jgi:hypothetical protein
MGDEPLTVAHNNRCPCERCIHNLSSSFASALLDNYLALHARQSVADDRTVHLICS